MVFNEKCKSAGYENSTVFKACSNNAPVQLVRHFTGLQSLLSTLQQAYQVGLNSSTRPNPSD